MLERLAKIARAASQALLYAGAGGLVLMTAIIGWQVFGRYVLNSSPSWSEQASLTLMIWYVSFAAAAGVREGFHIRIVALENAAPAGVRKVMRITASAVVALCGLALAVWGGKLVAATWEHVIPTLGLPRGVAYLCLPVSGALIFLFSVEKAVEEILDRAGVAGGE